MAAVVAVASLVDARDLESVIAVAEKALSTPEARAQQEDDMRQFVAFQVRAVSLPMQRHI